MRLALLSIHFHTISTHIIICGLNTKVKHLKFTNPNVLHVVRALTTSVLIFFLFNWFVNRLCGATNKSIRLTIELATSFFVFFFFSTIRTAFRSIDWCTAGFHLRLRGAVCFGCCLRFARCCRRSQYLHTCARCVRVIRSYFVHFYANWVFTKIKWQKKKKQTLCDSHATPMYVPFRTKGKYGGL